MYIVQTRLDCNSPWRNESQDTYEGLAKLEYEKFCKLYNSREVRLVKVTQVEILHSYPSDRRR